MNIEVLVSHTVNRPTRDDVAAMASWVASELIDALGEGAVLGHSGRVVGVVGTILIRLARGVEPTPEQISAAASAVGPHWSIETVVRPSRRR